MSPPPATEPPLRIVYMGTPDFAVPGLVALHASGFDIAGVVTAPDRPSGRGLRVQPSPVSVAAYGLGLPLLQPERLRDEAFLNELAAWKADLFVVVAFRMLPQVVWAMPPLGSLNLHASLLPHYRGAAPIHWAVVRGETETGLTTFRIEKDLDTGLIYLQERVPIPDDWTTGQLHDELSQRGAGLLVDTLKLLASGQATPVPQPAAPPDAFYARKITPEDARIDWHRSCEALYHHIRGFSPWPAAWTRLGDQQLKIYRAARADDLAPLAPPGQFQLSGGRWLVACADGWLDLLEVQLEGRRRMPAVELMRGLRIDGGQLGGGNDGSRQPI